MPAAKEILFPPFRLDRVNECLWRGAQAISLTPKAFAMLGYLVEHPGRLVSKEELLNAVWPEIIVSDAVLKVCIGKIRKTLGDQAKVPQFIETLHRRGYRFIAAVQSPKSKVQGQEQSRGWGREAGIQTQDSEPAPSFQSLTPDW